MKRYYSLIHGKKVISHQSSVISKKLVIDDRLLITNYQLLITTLAASLLFLLTLPPPSQAQTPDGIPSVSGGRLLWTENCAPCHGDTGQGDGPTAEAIENPLPDFTNVTTARHLSPSGNFEVIKNGRIENLMPPWGNRLDDNQIWDLTAQVWHLSTTPEDLAAGAEIYASQCVACHGEQGQGDGPDAPATMLDFADAATMSQVSQADLQAAYTANPAHAPLSDLSDTEQWQVLDHIRSFSFAIPQRNGLLNGVVTNGTTNAPGVDIPLTLRIIDGDREVEAIPGQSDGGGNFSFSDLPTDPNFLFLLEGQYQDIAFESDLGSFIHSGTETTLNLDIFEPTTDSSVIGETQLHYLIAFAPEGFNVLQIFIVANDSQQAYIGNGQSGSFEFAIPEVAENLTFQGDIINERFTRGEQGILDTKPILPGEEGLTIAATYLVRYNGDTINLDMPVLSPVDSINVLIEAREVELDSPQLTFVEERDLQGTIFAQFSGAALLPGDTLNMEFSNIRSLTDATAPEVTIEQGVLDQTVLRWAIIAVGVLALIGSGVVYPLVTSPPPDTDLAQQREKLLLLIAGLDERFEQGQVSEAVYQQARERYKIQLATLMQTK